MSTVLAPALDAVLAGSSTALRSVYRTLARGGALDVMVTSRRGRRFDIVVLDPPAFVQRRKDLKKGITAYRRIDEPSVSAGAGRLLVSASCSMHLARADAHRGNAAGSGTRRLRAADH
ncbi:MAG: hypothetical protein R3E54_18030 [Halioglobus sp.]